MDMREFSEYRGKELSCELTTLLKVLQSYKDEGWSEYNEEVEDNIAKVSAMVLGGTNSVIEFTEDVMRVTLNTLAILPHAEREDLIRSIQEWHIARIGKGTCSCFDPNCTNKWENYLHEEREHYTILARWIQEAMRHETIEHLVTTEESSNG